MSAPSISHSQPATQHKIRSEFSPWLVQWVARAAAFFLVAGVLGWWPVATGSSWATATHGGIDEAGSASAAPRLDEPVGPPDPEVVAILSAPGAFVEAKRTFTVYCTGCHGLFAGGGAGPNLTDLQTLYGGRYADILHIVTNGSPNRPMPAWREKLPEERIRLVAAYVYTLRGTRATSLPSSPSWHLLLAPGIQLPKR